MKHPPKNIDNASPKIVLFEAFTYVYTKQEIVTLLDIRQEKLDNLLIVRELIQYPISL